MHSNMPFIFFFGSLDHLEYLSSLLDMTRMDLACEYLFCLLCNGVILLAHFLCLVSDYIKICHYSCYYIMLSLGISGITKEGILHKI